MVTKKKGRGRINEEFRINRYTLLYVCVSCSVVSDSLRPHGL